MEWAKVKEMKRKMEIDFSAAKFGKLGEQRHSARKRQAAINWNVN